MLYPRFLGKMPEAFSGVFRKEYLAVELKIRLENLAVEGWSVDREAIIRLCEPVLIFAVLNHLI